MHAVCSSIPQTIVWVTVTFFLKGHTSQVVPCAQEGNLSTLLSEFAYIQTTKQAVIWFHPVTNKSLYLKWLSWEVVGLFVFFWSCILYLYILIVLGSTAYLWLAVVDHPLTCCPSCMLHTVRASLVFHWMFTAHWVNMLWRQFLLHWVNKSLSCMVIQQKDVSSQSLKECHSFLWQQ